MAAAKLANLAHGGDRRAEQAENFPLDAAPVLPTFEPEAPKPAPMSQGEAARLLNVSDRSLRTAKKVQDTAPQEVVAAPASAGPACREIPWVGGILRMSQILRRLQAQIRGFRLKYCDVLS